MHHHAWFLKRIFKSLLAGLEMFLLTSMQTYTDFYFHFFPDTVTDLLWEPIQFILSQVHIFPTANTWEDTVKVLETLGGMVVCL